MASHHVATQPSTSTFDPQVGASAQDLPLVHPVYLRLLGMAAAAEGIDLGAWLMPLGLDAAALARCDAPVPLVVWRRLMLGLQRLAPRPGLAIRLGRRFPLLAHGPLAYLMASSADLRQALDAIRASGWRSVQAGLICCCQVT
jgi:hypothetical protein